MNFSRWFFTSYAQKEILDTERYLSTIKELDAEATQLEERLSNLRSLYLKEAAKSECIENDLRSLTNMSEEHRFEKEYLQEEEMIRYRNLDSNLENQIRQLQKNIKIVQEKYLLEEKTFNTKLDRINLKGKGNYCIFLEKFLGLIQKFQSLSGKS